MTDNKFSVIGYGRFGSFWANIISAFHAVFAYDPHRSRIKESERICFADVKNCLQAEFVFLTLPISQMEKFLSENKLNFNPESVLIECASVKIKPAEWFSTLLPENIQYIHCHPLFGPDSARGGLANLNITLSPGYVRYGKLGFIRDFFENSLGLKILNYSAEEHDRLMAYNLSLIHHLGRAFAEMELGKLPLQMAGIQKLLSISGVVLNDSDQLFRDFYRFNPYAVEIKNHFLQTFQQISTNTN